MARGQNLQDTRPGSAPEITTDLRGLTFDMHVRGTGSHEHLVIRCDNAGEVWISIALPQEGQGPATPF